MPNFTFNESAHVYELDGKVMTGVTTILSVVGKPMLVPWAAKMTAEYIRDEIARCAISSGVFQSEKFHSETWPLILQEAVKAHTKKKEEGGTKGTDVHALVEEYIKGCINGNGGKAWSVQSPEKMVQNFIDWAVMKEVKFLASEKRVYNDDPDLWYAGTADFTCEIAGKRYVGDLKTMKKVWDRVPFFQTAAYMMALERMGEDKYDGSIIVNINKESGELTEHYTYDHENDKKAFLAALTLYRQLSNF